MELYGNLGKKGSKPLWKGVMPTEIESWLLRYEDDWWEKMSKTVNREDRDAVQTFECDWLSVVVAKLLRCNYSGWPNN